MMTPIDEMTVEEIFEVLRSRFDGVVLLTERDATKEFSERETYYAGGSSRALGLTALLHDRLLDMGRQRLVQDDDGDE